MKKLIKFNHIQLEKTADLLLDVSKTVLLGTVISIFVPGIGTKVGLAGSSIGFFVTACAYFFAIWLLKGVKEK